MDRATCMIFFLLLLALSLAACGSGKESDASEPLLDPNTDAGRGQALFKTFCATCHAVRGDRVVVGPSLDGVARRAATRIPGFTAAQYLEDSIIYPDHYVVEGYVPGSMQQNFDRQLTLEEVNYLVAYLLTLD